MPETYTRRISIYIESGQALAAQDQLLKKQGALTASIKEYTDAGKEIPEKMKKSLEDVTQALDRQAKKISGELSPSWKDYQGTVQNLERSLKRMSEQDPGFKKQKEDLEKAKKEADEYAKKVGLVKQKLGEAGEGGLIGKIAAGMGLESLAEKGIEKLLEFGKESIDEALKLEQAQLQLKNSLDNYGRSDALPKLKAQLEQLANRFNFFTEVDISGAQQKLVQFGKLSLNQINQLMPVLLNYAAKTGVTVADAADDITRGLFGMEGSGKRLHEMGIELDKNGNVAKNFGIIMKDLKVKVQDAGDAFATTRAGKMQSFFTRMKEDAMHAVDAISDFFGITTPEKTQIQLLEETKRGFDLNMEALKNANLPAEARKKLIQETNEKYKEYLPNLLSEKSSLDDINKAQDIGNKLLLTKILTIAYEKELKQIIEDQKDSIEKLTQAQIAQAKLNSAGAGDAFGLDPATMEERKKQAKTAEALNAAMINNTGKRVDELKEKFQLMAKNAGVAFEEIMKGMKENGDDKALFDPTGGKGVKETQREAYKKFLEKIAELNKEAQAAKINADAEEIQKVKDKYIQLENEARLYYKHHVIDAKQLANDLIQIAKIREQELANVGEKQSARKLNEQYAAQQQATIKYYDSEKALAYKNYAEELISKAEYDKQVEDLEVRSTAVQLSNFIDSYEARKKAAKGDVATLQQLETEKTTLTTAAEKARTVAILSEAVRRRDAIRAGDTADVINAQLNSMNLMGIEQARLKQLADNYAEELKLHGDTAEKKREINAKYAADAKKIEADTLKTIAGFVQEYSAYAINIWEKLDQVISNIETAEYNREKKKHDTSVKLLDDQLNKKIITQKTHDKHVQQLDEELDRKKHELDVKQFKRQQVLGIAKAIIAGGIASMNAWAEYGWPWALIPQAFIIAETAAEVAVIASQDPPSFGEGVEQLVGPKHNSPSGGMPVIDPETGQTRALLEGGEAIIRADSTAANKPIIRALNAAKGRSIADKFALARTNFNIERAVENIQFAAGGIFSRTPADNIGFGDITILEKAKGTGTGHASNIGFGDITILEKMDQHHKEHMAVLRKKQKLDFVLYDFNRFLGQNDIVYKRNNPPA